MAVLEGDAVSKKNGIVLKLPRYFVFLFFQGFTYPVQTHFLEDILEMTGYRLTPDNQIDDYGQEKTWKMNKQAPRKRKTQIALAVEVTKIKKKILTHFYIIYRLVFLCHCHLHTENVIRIHSELLISSNIAHKHRSLCHAGFPIVLVSTL